MLATWSLRCHHFGSFWYQFWSSGFCKCCFFWVQFIVFFCKCCLVCDLNCSFLLYCFLFLLLKIYPLIKKEKKKKRVFFRTQLILWISLIFLLLSHLSKEPLTSRAYPIFIGLSTGLLPCAGFLQKAFSTILLLQGVVMASSAFSILYFLIALRDGLEPFQQNYKILFHLDIRQFPELPKGIAGSHFRNVGAV